MNNFGGQQVQQGNRAKRGDEELEVNTRNAADLVRRLAPRSHYGTNQPQQGDNRRAC